MSSDTDEHASWRIRPRVSTKRDLKRSKTKRCIDLLHKFIYDVDFDVRFHGHIDLEVQWVIINALNNLALERGSKSYKMEDILTDQIHFAGNYKGRLNEPTNESKMSEPTNESKMSEPTNESKMSEPTNESKMSESEEGDMNEPQPSESERSDMNEQHASESEQSEGDEKTRYQWVCHSENCGRCLANRHGVYEKNCYIAECISCSDAIVQCIRCSRDVENLRFKCENQYCGKFQNVEDRLFDFDYEECLYKRAIYIDLISKPDSFNDDRCVEDCEFIAKFYDSYTRLERGEKASPVWVRNNDTVCTQYNITNLVIELWNFKKAMPVTQEFMIESNRIFYDQILKHQTFGIGVSPNISLEEELYLYVYAMKKIFKIKDTGGVRIQAACDICYKLLVSEGVKHCDFRSKICGTCHNRYDICENCFDSTKPPLCCSSGINAFGEQMKSYDQVLADRISRSEVYLYFESAGGGCKLHFYQDGKLEFTKEATKVYNQIRELIG